MVKPLEEILMGILEGSDRLLLESQSFLNSLRPLNPVPFLLNYTVYNRTKEPGHYHSQRFFTFNSMPHRLEAKIPGDSMTKRKMHPKSLENLTHEGRPQAFEEPKQRRYLSVTASGWEGAQQVAKAAGCRGGVSEFLERLGRGEFEVAEVDRRESSD
jgi:hypothetical protein